MKWSQKTKTFTMCGGWSSSIIVSMPVKSIWSSSKEEVTRIACSGALAQAPSCWIHLSQPLIVFCICIAMPGHQNWSCNMGQCLPLALVTHISITPVYGCHSMSHGDYKPQSLFQLSDQSMVVIEGTMIEHVFLPLPNNGHTLFHHGMVPQEMFEILYFMGGNPLSPFWVWDLLAVQPPSLLHASLHVHGWPMLGLQFPQLMYPLISCSPLPGHGNQPFLWSLWGLHPGWTSQLLHSALI